MRLESVTPLLRTEDLKRPVDFYREVLGFQRQAFDEEAGWARVACGGVEILLAVPNAHEPFERPAFTGSLCFRSDDVDEAWERLEDRARVCDPIEDFAYGMREFAVDDDNGYPLQFGQDVSRESRGRSSSCASRA